MPGKVAANRKGSQFGLCSPTVRGSKCVLLSLLAALGCAHAPVSQPGLPYPGVPRPPVSGAPQPASLASAPLAPQPPGFAQRSINAGLGGPALAFGEAPFAGEGPLVVERASSDGSWVAVCQARQDTNGDGKVSVSANARGDLSGDTMQRWLLTPGAEFGIDALLGSDASGRYTLVRQAESTLLRDQRSRQTLDLSALGADVGLSAESFAALRTLAFDDSGQRFLYLRSGPAGNVLHVRSLSEGTERELNAGSVAVWRARFDPGGAYVALEIPGEDTNRNGRVERPAALLSKPEPCHAGPGRFHTWSGDRPATLLVPVNGGALIREPELLMPVRDALLLRDGAGALLLSRGGKKRVLEPAACKGRIVHADIQRELFIIGCAQKKTGRVSLELVTRAERRPLDIELASVDLDREASDSPRLVPLYPGQDSALFDADRLQLALLKTGDVVIAVRSGRALVRRGKALVLFDADSQSERALPGELDRFPDLLVTPPYVYVSPVLVSLEQGKSVVVERARPLALSNGGQLLYADSPADGTTLARGPLHWEPVPL